MNSSKIDIVGLSITHAPIPHETECAIVDSGKRLLTKAISVPDGTATHYRNFWSRLKDVARPRLVLVPLSRIGGSQGFSGSQVLIGYFIDTANTSLYPSRPMVIKVARVKNRTQDPLLDEKQRANEIGRYITHSAETFAVPIFHSHQKSHSLLWSPFHSNAREYSGHKNENHQELTLEIRDLWMDLWETPGNPDIWKTIKKTLDTVFEVMRPVHHMQQKLEARNITYGEEYKWYLRDIENAWGNSWIRIWGNKQKPEISDLGKPQTNPFWVLDKIQKRKSLLHCGAIHGDLHPKNIVYGPDGTPRLIDFGWANSTKHILKDFVLLECNLRFVLLKSDVSFEDLSTLANWVSLDDQPPRFRCNYLQGVAEAISIVRAKARIAMPVDADWNDQYIVPLFLVAFGLLKHLHNYRNQLSARMTVLALATYVHNHIIKQSDAGRATRAQDRNEETRNAPKLW